MSDDKSNRGPQDRACINLNESYEPACWTTELGVSEMQSRAAVAAAGVSAEAVRRYLRK